MTALATPSSSVAFATPHAGEDYLASEAHYLSLAGRLVAALRRGSVFVLLTGDPPPDPLLFSRALETAAAWWYAVIVIARGTDISGDQLLRASPRLAASGGRDWGFQTGGSAPALSPLFVFDAAEGLSGEQIEHLYQSLVHSDGMRSAGVLLARNAFLARLERSNPRLIEGELTACLRVQELGRDEIETFIRRQQRPGEQPDAFTAEAIAAIADVSRGDPALVNHLARLTLEFAALAGSKGKEAGIDRVDETRAPVATVDEQRPAAEPAAGRLPSRPLHRRRSVRAMQIGVLLGLAITGLVAVRDDGVMALAQRAEHSLAAIRSADFVEAWIKPVRGNASPAGADSVSHPAAVTSVPIAADQATRLQAEPVFVAAIPAHPGGERADASSTNEAASPQPAPPNDQAEAIPTPAPEPVSGRSVGAAPPATTARLLESQPTAPQPVSAQSRLSNEEIAALVTRGDDLVGVGDIASARLFYAHAVEAGDGRAALRMGATFDPAFLDRAGIRGIAGNQREALSWYRRARDLGQAEAERRLGTIVLQ
jgi:hypothetical protein